MVFFVEDAVSAPEHDGHPTNGQAVPDDPLLAAGVLNIHCDRSGVGDVPQTTLVRGRGPGHVEGFLDFCVGKLNVIKYIDGKLGVIFANTWPADMDVQVLEITGGVSGGDHLGVCGHNVLELRADEIVERIDVLFDQTPDLEEGGNQMPFALQTLDGFAQLLRRTVGPGRVSVVLAEVAHFPGGTRFSAAIARNFNRRSLSFIY